MPRSRPRSEGGQKGNLGAVRSSLSIYYEDTEGRYPDRLEELLVGGKYMGTIPQVQLAPHPKTRAVTYHATRSPLDTGGFGYVNNPYDPDYGTLWLDCTHTDPRGAAWASY